MSFFSDIKNSVYSPKFYGEVLAKPFSFSFKYYFLFILLLSLITTVVLSFSIAPKVVSFVDLALNRGVDFYPSELEINIVDGKVSTNVQEPYFLRMPAELKTSELQGMENLIVIDTKNDFSLARYASYKTAILLTETSIVYPRDGAIAIQPLNEVSGLTINKLIVVSFVNKIKPFVRFIYPIMGLFIWIAQFFALAFKLVYLFVAALLIWLIAATKKIKLGYWKSYRLGLHLMTLGIIMQAVFSIADIVVFPFFFTLLLVALALINIKKYETYETALKAQ